MLTKTKIAITLICLCAVIILGEIAAAAMPDRPERPDPKARREQQMKDRMEKMSKELEQKAAEIDDKLVTILELINNNQIPNDQTIAMAGKVLENNAGDLAKFPPEVGCQYLMLQAWTDFFSDDALKAGQSAARAAKMDPSNNDAEITEVAISVLTDNTPRIRKKPPQNMMMNTQSERGRGQRNQQSRPGLQVSARGSSGDILEFDIDAVKPEMFGRKIEAMELTCANQTSLTCDPAQSNLCILLWQLPKDPELEDEDSASAKALMRDRTTTRPDMRQDPRMMMQRPGAPGQPPTRPDMMNQRRPDMPPGMPPEMMLMMRPDMMQGQFGQSDPANTLPKETKAFGKIYRSEFANSDLKFLAVNIDEPEKAKEVIDEIFDHPQLWPQVLKSQPGSGVSQFDDVKIEKPLLAVADKSGTIKYAGPAAGFLARMILARFTETDLIAVEGTIPDPNVPAGTSDVVQNALPKVLTPKKIQPRTKPAVNTTGDETITPELFQAGKLYEAANGLFIPSGKKRMLTSKKGVELCREVITKYPDTEYADKSRLLLRELSDSDKQKYKITNEEMGL